MEERESCLPAVGLLTQRAPDVAEEWPFSDAGLTIAPILLGIKN